MYIKTFRKKTLATMILCVQCEKSIVFFIKVSPNTARDSLRVQLTDPRVTQRSENAPLLRPSAQLSRDRHCGARLLASG